MIRRVLIVECPRCGMDHEARLRRFDRPPDGLECEWWAKCPITGDPVLVDRDDVWWSR